jgi:hypothetical protein
MKQALQKLLIDFLKGNSFGDWFGRKHTRLALLALLIIIIVIIIIFFQQINKQTNKGKTPGKQAHKKNVLIHPWGCDYFVCT